MREIKKNCIYKHFKGDLYFVEDFATNTETSEQMVVYRALYGENKLYVRPYSMFASAVDKQKYPDCKQTYRYEETTIESKNK